jgi:hypothetical protein
MAKMIHAKYLITVVLLLVPIFAAAQPVLSQQYMTTTSTTLVTSNQMSTLTVGTQIITTTAGQTTPIFSGNITVPGTHGVCGVYFVQAFNGTTGELLIGSVAASSAVDIYLMTAATFQSWSHQIVAGGNCTPSSLVASQKATTYYNFTTTLPSTDGYDLVVDNLSQSTVMAKVDAALATSPPSLVTIIAYSTTSQQIIQTLMQTSVQTLQTTSSGPDTTTIAGAIIGIIIVIAAAAYLAKTRRGKK